MKKTLIGLVALGLTLSLALTGCVAKKAASSKEAIDISKTMETTKEKVDYLVGQAKAFYNSDKFQNAIDVTQYILRYLDKDSPQAKDILNNAKTDLTAQIKERLEKAKRNFNLGK